MALNLDAIGKPIGPIKRNYSWKDAVLYALGIGAGFSELHYCFEKNLKVIPSFSVAMIFDFLSQAAVTSGVNLTGILHGEQELIFHRPIPPEGTLITTGTIVDCYDKGRDKGALVVAQSETSDKDGQQLFTSIMTIFGRLDGGFGGKDRKTSPVVFPDRAPDFTVEALPSVDQPLLYRLSGDIFHLHVDPEFAKSAGFDMPIMHGLCTHGFACRALIASLVPGRPELVRRLACRFSKALYPGIPIRTVIWKTGRGQAVWRTINTQTEEIVIDNGEFEYGDVPRDQIRFDGRVAIVTGAGAGLGRIYALELARRGAKVVVNDLGGARDGTGGGSSAPADRVVAEIRDAGGEAVANYDDVATIDGGANLVDTAVNTFGTVHILINNAGILKDKSFVKMTAQNWQAVVDVHLKGAFNVTRPAFAVMKESGFGRIIMTTSAAGLYGNFGQGNYAAAKMGVVGLMNTLKLEGKKYDIKVNAVAPIAASRLTEDVMPPDLYQQSKPEFVSPLVLYLCSDRCPASGNIYNAGMGVFSRVAMLTGQAAVVGKAGQPPTPEQVEAQWERINRLDEVGEFADLTGALTAMLSPPTTVAAKARQSEPQERRKLAIAAIFEKMPDVFVQEAAAGVNAVFQYHVTGPCGGDWQVIVRDQSCTVAQGCSNQATCSLRIADNDLIDLINGDLLAVKAYTSGRLTIEGDVMQAQLIDRLFPFQSAVGVDRGSSGFRDEPT